MALRDDLEDLVNFPEESLDAEYKSAIDLSDAVSRANFARHVAALANHGGGTIVLGFNDDLTRAPKTEFADVDRDAVAGIVKHFLEPALQCQVRVVTARTGARHTIIVVPSHGEVPICTRKSGPHDSQGCPQGISTATYYVRKPGPSSEIIRTSSEWAPLIRRCALANRASILGAISAALNDGRFVSNAQGAASESAVDTRLREWHAALAKGYHERLVADDLTGEIDKGYMQFSFLVHRSRETIPHDRLLETIGRCNREADAITRAHSGPFMVLHHDPFAPKSRTAPELDNGEVEFLECAIIEMNGVIPVRDMWRISGDGIASLIRGWWEDTPQFGQSPKTCISPTWLAKEVAGCVLFTRVFANDFDTAMAVTFRCEWTGLSGRKPFDHYGRWQMSGHASEDDRRVGHVTVPLAELNDGWEATTAKLAGTVARAVGLGHILTADWLSNQATNWARQP